MSVEGGGRFNSESERFFSPRREPERANESLDSIEELIEYLRNPENREEIVSFWEYIGHLQEFVLQYVPARQRAQALRQLHQSITTTVQVERASETPAPVVTGRSATRTIPVGEHMDLTLGTNASYQWPDEAKATLLVGSGTLVTPSTPVGVIDYYRNIDKLNTDSSLVGFSRALIASAKQSLRVLAADYSSTGGFNERGTEGRSTHVFSGMSHLARLADRFGFTVFDIQDTTMRAHATDTSFGIATRVAEVNSAWQKLRENYKPAKVAMISGSDLVRRYGSK